MLSISLSSKKLDHKIQPFFPIFPELGPREHANWHGRPGTQSRQSSCDWPLKPICAGHVAEPTLWSGLYYNAKSASSPTEYGPGDVPQYAAHVPQHATPVAQHAAEICGRAHVTQHERAIAARTEYVAQHERVAAAHTEHDAQHERDVAPRTEHVTQHERIVATCTEHVSQHECVVAWHARRAGPGPRVTQHAAKYGAHVTQHATEHGPHVAQSGTAPATYLCTGKFVFLYIFSTLLYCLHNLIRCPLST